MLKDITLGQYYTADSAIHRLDPRVKLVATLFFIIAIFVANDPIGFAFITVCLAAVIIMSKVPVSYMVRGLRSIIILLLICGLFNIFLTPGDPIVKWGRVQITIQGVRAAVLMLVRMIYLIIGTSIMTLTTTPNQLTDGLETGLRWLNYIHVPVHEIAMMMSIALRFIPILSDETDKIMKAQMARGAEFDGKGIVKKAKAMVPLLVPLFVSAFRRANDLALAMEARCYHGGEGRTSMKPLHYLKRDVLAYLFIFAFLAAVIVLHILF